MNILWKIFGTGVEASSPPPCEPPARSLDERIKAKFQLKYRHPDWLCDGEYIHDLRKEVISVEACLHILRRLHVEDSFDEIAVLAATGTVVVPADPPFVIRTSLGAEGVAGLIEHFTARGTPVRQHQGCHLLQYP